MSLPDSIVNLMIQSCPSCTHAYYSHRPYCDHESGYGCFVVGCDCPLDPWVIPSTPQFLIDCRYCGTQPISRERFLVFTDGMQRSCPKCHHVVKESKITTGNHRIRWEKQA